MTAKTDPLARRAELREQHDKVLEQLDDAEARLATIRAEQEDPTPAGGRSRGAPRPLKASRDLAEARTAAHRSTIDADEVEQAAQALAAVQAEIEALTATQRSARQAEQEISRDLNDLLVADFSAFAAEAERKVDECAKAAEALLPALEAYRTAWEEARAAWYGLCRVNEMQAAPHCPLPAPDEVRGLLPRPPSTEQPASTLILTYRDGNGRMEAVRAGDAFHAELESRPDEWTLVEQRRGARGTPIRTAELEAA